MQQIWPADKTERVSVKSLVPYANNARTHSDEQIAQIMSSIREWGFTTPILRDDSGMVIAGHGRLLAAMRLGLEDVPVMTATGWSESQKKAYVIADNRLALSAGWDDGLLSVEIGDLDEAGFDLELLGFDDGEIGDLLAGEEDEDAGADTEPQDDRAEELREKWGVETGQLWRLGDHRLLCGDATNKDDVSTVNVGSKADVCLTDPPYGLGNSNSDKNNYIQYDDSVENLDRIIAGFFPLAELTSDLLVMTPGNKNQHRYKPPTWTMAWFVPAGVGQGPWGFVCWQPILCYGKDPKLSKRLGSHPDALVHTESSEKLGHPCTKPIRFWEWLVKRVSENGETIYDPFSGSGTTIIACENLGRKCRAIEISPAYVAVALQRWADHTGGEPELVASCHEMA